MKSLMQPICVHAVRNAVAEKESQIQQRRVHYFQRLLSEATQAINAELLAGNLSGVIKVESYLPYYLLNNANVLLQPMVTHYEQQGFANVELHFQSPIAVAFQFTLCVPPPTANL